MRRPHRNIEIFSMSVLDMFASALGAFIMCAIILFPYYKKDVSKELGEARDVLEKAKFELKGENQRARNADETIRGLEPAVESARKALGNLKQCRLGANLCQAELAKTFLMVQIEWKGSVDVNLHVTDPRGHEFYWAKTNRTGRDYPASRALLSIDVVSGPGIEVWVDPEATLGEYRIDYVIPRNPHPAVQVTGFVFDRTGKRNLPTRTLPDGQLRLRASTLTIADDGVLSVR